VSLFTKNKNEAVRAFVLKLINNNCPGLTALKEGPRLDSRVNLAVVLTVIPVEDGQIQVDGAFAAVTKDFSITGVSVVLDRPEMPEWAVLGFRFQGQTTFLLAETKHRDPMGGGFYQLGFQLTEVVTPADYPELEAVGTSFSASSRSSRGS
jgi:hypothetical protein